MRALLIAVLVLLVASAGYWFYSQKTTSETTDSALSCSFEVTHGGVTKTMGGTDYAVNQITIEQGESFDLSWSTKNATEGVVSSGRNFPSGEAGVVQTSGTGSLSATQDTVFSLEFRNTDEVTECGVMVYVTGPKATATIDPESLTATTGTPTITGTASVSHVGVYISQKSTNLFKNLSGYVTFTGNRWSAPFTAQYSSPLEPGIYTVIVSTHDGHELARETLTISAP